MPPDAAKKPLPPAKGQPATIVTYFPNVDMKAAENGRYRSRYWENLHDALNGQAEAEPGGSGHFVRWLFIRFPAPQLSQAQCLTLRDRFRASGRDGASFHYLEEFLRTRDLFGALWRHARLCLASLRTEKEAREAFHFAGSNINFWEYLGQYWAESFRGWRSLERCLQHRAFKRYAALAGQQRWTLFPLENCPWERMSVVVADTTGKTQIITKGALEEMLTVCAFAEYHGQVEALTPELRSEILERVRRYNSNGLRVVGVAHKTMLRKLSASAPISLRRTRSSVQSRSPSETLLA